MRQRWKEHERTASCSSHTHQYDHHAHHPQHCTHSRRVIPHSSHCCIPPFHLLPFTLLLLALSFPLVTAQRLFFSLYIHNPAYTIIEVYNPSCTAVSLDEFSVRIASNPGAAALSGAQWGTPIPFTGPSPTLNSLSTRVMCNTPSAHAQCVNSTSTRLIFDGDDAIGLFHHDVLIDVIGERNSLMFLSPSPFPKRAAPWTVAGVAQATKLRTLRRKSTVREGTIGFFNPRGKSVSNVDSSEWSVSDATSGTTYVGAFTCWSCVCPSSLLRATCGTRGSDLSIQNMITTYASVTGQANSVQIECPLDCLHRTAVEQQYGAMQGPAVVTPRSYVFVSGTGVNQRYHPDCPICLAAIHSDALHYAPYALPDASFTPQPATATIRATCQYLPSSTLPITYDSADYPASQRVRGRPLLLLTSESGTFTFPTPATQHRCVEARNTAGSAQAFNIQLLDVTVCDTTNCGSVGIASVHGHCNQNTATCTCNQPFYGSYCQYKRCPYPCFNGGSCDSSTGLCSCPAGFSGLQCQLTACNCNNRGVCDGEGGLCECYTPFHGHNCQYQSCPNDCLDRGVCDPSTGRCTCSSGFSGEDCSLRLCAHSCSGFGSCDYTTGQCRCENGGGGLVPADCETDACPTNDPAKTCSGHGACDYAARRCTCQTGWIGEDCSQAAPV